MRGGIWMLARCTTYQRSTALELPGRQEEAGRGMPGVATERAAPSQLVSTISDCGSQPVGF